MGQSCHGCYCIKEEKAPTQDDAPIQDLLAGSDLQTQECGQKGDQEGEILFTNEDADYLKKVKERHDRFSRLSDYSKQSNNTSLCQHGEEAKKLDTESSPYSNKSNIQAAPAAMDWNFTATDDDDDNKNANKDLHDTLSTTFIQH